MKISKNFDLKIQDFHTRHSSKLTKTVFYKIWNEKHSTVLVIAVEGLLPTLIS